MNGIAKLKELRGLMSKLNIAAYIVPNADDHMSEYLLETDRRREYITGFTGSTGTAVVTEDKAALWIDSRYYIQAKREVDLQIWNLMEHGEEGVRKRKVTRGSPLSNELSSFGKLMDLKTPLVLKVHEWLAENVRKDTQVGVDPKKIDSVEYEMISKYLAKEGVKLIPVESNLIDEIWKDRPPYPEATVYIHDLKYAGEHWEDKVERVNKALNGSALVVSALDEVAWLTNLRGSDFPHSPLFRSFLILKGNEIYLYLPPEKVTQTIKDHLQSAKFTVKIKNYDKFWDDIVELGTASKNITIPTLKRGGTSYYVKHLLPSEKCLNKTSPILELKSYKNAVEAEGMRRAHVKDSVALCKVMMDIVNDVENGNGGWDEFRVVNELEKVRAEQELNMGSSFPTIAAFGPNSALPHYRVSNETNFLIDTSGPLTIDSGGQYLDGTIDTTRVVRAGLPSKTEIDVYTALLRGTINLVTTVFPEGTRMNQLEFIARRPLYQSGRDFGHGITHGTGSFLNVHEGYNGTLRENFVGSQEPGYYRENEFGMRLENLVIVVPASVENFTKRRLMTFEALTLVPYEQRLIDLSQMEATELTWLNNYHKKVRDLVGAEMLAQNKKDLYDWLVKQTEPLLP